MEFSVKFTTHQGVNGNLGGFSCRIDKKIKLLQFEKNRFEAI